MKKVKLQKKSIIMITALTAVSVILAIALFFYQKSGGFNGQSIPTVTLILLIIFLVLLPILLVIFLIVKKSKVTYWIGCSIVGISVIIIGLLLFTAGGLTDSRTKLVISTDSQEKIYDGKPLVCEEWKLSGGKLKTGHTIVVAEGASRTDAGSSANNITFSILSESNEDVTDSYNIEIQAGELRVNALKLAIKTGSTVKEYDGTPLKYNDYKLIRGEILTEQTLAVECLGERTDAGIIDNTFDAIIRDANKNDVTHNYDIVKILGKLEIKKRNISILTPSYHSVYDSTPKTYKEWEYASETRILEQHKIAVIVSGSQTDVGISKNSIGEVRITEGEKNVSGNYSVTYLEGELIVTPRKITLRSASAKKIYNGEPLTKNEWEYASQTKIADKQTLTVVISGTRTEPGESVNTIAETLVRTSGGKDVSFNYEIKLQEGSLIVVVQGQEPGGDPSEPDGGALDESGAIGGGGSGGGGGGGSGSVSARVYSEMADSIYLRYMNFGDYSGTKWNTAADYTALIDSKYSLNYLTGIALENAGYKSSAVSIESFSSNYLLPYYLDTDEFSYKIQTSDVKHSGNTSSVYSAYYYLFNYENDGLNIAVPSSYSQLEQAYFNYVKSVYLQIADSTLSSFSSIIEENGFNKNNADIISAVADYIRSAAVYNIAYDQNLDTMDDIAVSFLSTYKQGICQHFATAATMLYRALGIPSRYVIGYSGQTKSGEWVDFGADKAHAWVEVYLSGIGWIAVEVTPGGVNSGGESGSGGSESRNKLTIKPIDVSMMYTSGAVLLPENRVQGLSDLLADGYNYSAEITGKQTAVGFGSSSISTFVLYDSSGKDVTEQFNIIKGKGKLHLYLRELSVKTESLSKIYDGIALGSEKVDGNSWDGDLIKGHTLKKFAMVGLQTNVGMSENSCDIRIADESGGDVTYMYKINKDYGTLTVDVREIVIEAGSAIKPHDGESLTCADYVLSALEGDKALGQGDTITVKIHGEQTDIGRSQNEVSTVKIVNQRGSDVTRNYSIKCLSGWLVVTVRA